MENLNPIKLFLNRIYYFLFVERYNKKLDIKFPKNIYRWDLIQHIIDKYSFKNYLEIGCDKNQSFSKINIKNKVGVDPVSGGTIRDTSDNFFKINKDKFDIIFIDGLHHYKQVLKDIKNSLKILNQNGFILIHDCLPRSIAHQAIPRYRGSWNGDVWKSIVEMRTLDNIETYTCQIDFGVGVIKNIKNSDILKINLNDFSKLKFKDYYHNYKKYMRVVDYENLLDII
jgi:SAM-dependent methyltransferase